MTCIFVIVFNQAEQLSYQFSKDWTGYTAGDMRYVRKYNNTLSF